MSFVSPDRTHELDIENIRLAAHRVGIGMEIQGHYQFRNWQRFGVQSTQTFFTLTCDDKGKLERFAGVLLLAS